MDRGERRKRTSAKVNQRGKMIKDYGLQGGTLYEKHRNKINNSLGYMRTGNVSHYVSVGFNPKTKPHSYGKAKNLSKRDLNTEYNYIQQLIELKKQRGDN